MNIKIDDLKFKIIKQVKDILPGEIGVYLKNKRFIDDATDPIILYRTDNEHRIEDDDYNLLTDRHILVRMEHEYRLKELQKLINKKG